MDSTELRNLHEAYLDVYDNELSEDYMDEGASGDVAARAQKLANQRKGQTPERKKMYQDLANKASERETGPRIIDVGGRGKRKGLTQSDRDARREYDAEFSYETGDKNSTPGPGTITKNKRKLAAQKARGQHAESFDLYDIILSHLIDGGYAETEGAAESIMVNMSEEWREDILAEAITSEKGKAKAAEMIADRSTPSGRAKSGKCANVAQIRQIRGSGRGDFDREGLGGTPMTPTMAKNPIKKQNYTGTGNKAARRAGTYKESFNIFVNSMIAEGVSMERYTWEEIQNVFDDLFEAQVANRNPDEYERKAKQGQSREQQLKGKVMGRMSQMDPDKKAAMLKQMRAVGLDV